jgi:hypothetical protein
VHYGSGCLPSGRTLPCSACRWVVRGLAPLALGAALPRPGWAMRAVRTSSCPAGKVGFQTPPARCSGRRRPPQNS